MSCLPIDIPLLNVECGPGNPSSTYNFKLKIKKGIVYMNKRHVGHLIGFDGNNLTIKQNSKNKYINGQLITLQINKS